jgi:hypothetical protein
LSLNTDVNGILQTSLPLSDGSHTIEIELTNTIVNEIDSDHTLKIVPNPAKNELNININSTVQNSKVEIVNLLGELQISTDILQGIDISKLSDGIYIVKIVVGEKRFSAKFIKE